MSYFEAFIFGLVQGITEFLPISSTAHLAIAERWMGHSFPGLALEIYLHLASVIAVLLFYRRDVYQLIDRSLKYLLYRKQEDLAYFRFALLILIATLITGVLGVFLKGWLGERLEDMRLIGVSLILTGVFLLWIDRARSTATGRNFEQAKWSDGLWVGLVQTLAVIPGISRSGSSLIAALWVGLDRETAVRFSFLLAIPVILGSTLIGIQDAADSGLNFLSGPLLLSFVTTLVCSLLGIRWLLSFVLKQKLFYFAIYCFLVGPAIILWL